MMALTEPSWRHALAGEFKQAYFKKIETVLHTAGQSGVAVYPPEAFIFNAFNSTPLSKVKVVLLGQDPYHQPNQAMGLSFSVPSGEKIPPSLRNVYKELAATVDGFVTPTHGNLSRWAEQGVLMLNAALTVEHGKAGSHARIGWQTFTDAVMDLVSEQCEGVVFLLWGNFAKKKASRVDATRHHVLTAIHPSPLAGGGFLGCNHFERCNELLLKQGKTAIDWQI